MRRWLAGLLLVLVACDAPEPGPSPVSPEPPATAVPIPAAAPEPEPAPVPPVSAPEPASAAPAPPRIAIIIDDIGNARGEGLRAIALPGPLAYAVIPHTPHARELAEAAHAAGKPVMVHMPMSNGGKLALGDGALFPGMSRADFAETLALGIAAVPHAEGLNNHTGSELTALDEPMAWLMQELKGHALFFIDSRTTAASVAGHHAAVARIPHASRQVFLDHDVSPEAIDAAWQRLLGQARQHGQAIAIGHPYPQTLAYLAAALPALAAEGITLVPVTALLQADPAAGDE